MRAAEALHTLWWGPPLTQDRPRPRKTAHRLVEARADGLQAAVEAAVSAAEAAGLQYLEAVAVAPGSLLLAFQEPPLEWRRYQPGEAAYERAEAAAWDAASYLSYLVSAHLPKEEPSVPPDPDDPDYVPDEVGPRADEDAKLEQADSAVHDDLPDE